MKKPPQDRPGTGTTRDAGSNVQCPCCESVVPKSAIDPSALTPEAKATLDRSDRKQRFASTRSIVDQMREQKSARMRGKLGL